MVECMTKPPLSDFSVFDMERPSGRFCKFRIVRYDDHCLLQLLMQLEEDIFDRFTGFRIQVPGGLVAEDHLWLIDERCEGRWLSRSPNASASTNCSQYAFGTCFLSSIAGNRMFS